MYDKKYPKLCTCGKVLINKKNAHKHYLKYPLCRIAKTPIEHLIKDRQHISDLQISGIINNPNVNFIPTCEQPIYFKRILLKKIVTNKVVGLFLDK